MLIKYHSCRKHISLVLGICDLCGFWNTKWPCVWLLHDTNMERMQLPELNMYDSKFFGDHFYNSNATLTGKFYKKLLRTNNLWHSMYGGDENMVRFLCKLDQSIHSTSARKQFRSLRVQHYCFYNSHPCSSRHGRWFCFIIKKNL
jgi:hypothetical protein